MDFPRYLMIVVSVLLVFHTETCLSVANPGVLTFLTDFIQQNLVGTPVIHEKTEWDFDPEVGKQRRIRYEQENGRYGEIAIAKNGMGVGYKGSWGTPV
ncbi:uncharacterized protein LOC117218798 [Megalopta genalis]|uniref:uncharacterized protein LOC117218798 n=1 Tax=Megalopta genalis TaxID=115081 RepID=UPI001442FD81|nr:uncharacterized protein LOC117218798 [Megalopta genalis]